MTYVGRADDGRAGGIAVWRRLAAWPHAPAAGAVLLGMLAVAEAVWAAVNSPGSLPGYSAAATGDWPFVLVVLIVVSLATTLPLGFLWGRPAWAALALSAAALVTLAIFQTLTVAGLITELASAYRLGRRGSPLLAAGLTLPFLVLALAGSGGPVGSAAHIQALLLASLGPAAGLAGSARRAHREAIENSAAREAIAGSLHEHTARGERARISRELHDVVA
ncbi:MAG TPA: hypothetical protein VF933_04930, partial [Streptosporangiaceae bacterium]